MKKDIRSIKRLTRKYFHSLNIKTLEKTLEELNVFNDLINSGKELKSVLCSPLFDMKDKETAVNVFKERLGFSEVTEKFLKQLIFRSAVTLLPDVINSLTNVYLEAKNMVRAVVLSPVNIESASKERLKKSLSGILEKEVDLNYSIDPTLIGGIVVKAGSMMFDSSLKGQLRLLRDEMLKERMN